MDRKDRQRFKAIVSRVDDFLKRSHPPLHSEEDLVDLLVDFYRPSLRPDDLEVIELLARLFLEALREWQQSNPETVELILPHSSKRAVVMYVEPFFTRAVDVIKRSRTAARYKRASTREHVIKGLRLKVEAVVDRLNHASMFLSSYDEADYPEKAEAKAKFRTDPVAQALVKVLWDFDTLEWTQTADPSVFQAVIPDHKVVSKVMVKKLPEHVGVGKFVLGSPSNGVSRSQFNIESFDPSDAVVALYAIDRLIQTRKDCIELSLDELLSLEGCRLRSERGFRFEQAERYRRIFLLVSRLTFSMDRRWLSGKAGSKSEPTGDCLESAAFSFHGSKMLIDEYVDCVKTGDPAEWKKPLYAIGATPYIKEMWKGRGESWLGELEKIASIQSGKITGRWAKSSAIALTMQYRNNAKQAIEHGVNLSRSTLIHEVRVAGDERDLLDVAHPERVHENFCNAMKKLRKQKIISAWFDDADTSRRGWQKGWLKQVIHFEVGDYCRDELALIADKRRNPSEKRKKQSGP